MSYLRQRMFTGVWRDTHRRKLHEGACWVMKGVDLDVHGRIAGAPGYTIAGRCSAAVTSVIVGSAGEVLVVSDNSIIRMSVKEL